MSEIKSLFMPLNLSSIADKSSILYEGRARLSEIADIPGMADESWKTRLADSITANGKSKREVSLAAGMGAGYVHSILSEGKDPTIDNLLSVCDAAGVSLYYVLYGVKMDPDTEAIVQKLQASSPAKRRGLLEFLRDENTEEEPSS